MRRDEVASHIIVSVCISEVVHTPGETTTALCSRGSPTWTTFVRSVCTRLRELVTEWCCLGGRVEMGGGDLTVGKFTASYCSLNT